MVSRFARTIDTIPHPLPRELPFPKGALVKSLPLGGRVRLFLSMTTLMGYSLNARTINAIPQSPLVTAPFTKGSLFLFG